MRKRHRSDRRDDRQFWRLWKSQNGQCVWCDQRMTTHRPDSGEIPSPLMATIDHVIPKAQGGGRDRPNRVLACRGCNEQRGHEL
jgi:5-methylcytosine-specific restriction endonuclease McrA